MLRDDWRRRHSHADCSPFQVVRPVCVESYSPKPSGMGPGIGMWERRDLGNGEQVRRAFSRSRLCDSPQGILLRIEIPRNTSMQCFFCAIRTCRPGCSATCHKARDELSLGRIGLPQHRMLGTPSPSFPKWELPRMPSQLGLGNILAFLYSSKRFPAIRNSTFFTFQLIDFREAQTDKIIFKEHF